MYVLMFRDGLKADRAMDRSQFDRHIVGRMAQRGGSATGWIGKGIAVAATIAVPEAFASAWAFQVWVERRLAEDGYVRCGTDPAGRFPSSTLCLRKTVPT